jgi:hypothetical protein
MLICDGSDEWKRTKEKMREMIKKTCVCQEWILMCRSNYGRMRMRRNQGKSYRTKHSVLMITLISKIAVVI